MFLRMNEEEDDEESYYCHSSDSSIRFFTAEDVNFNSQEIKDLGVVPLRPDVHATLSGSIPAFEDNCKFPNIKYNENIIEYGAPLAVESCKRPKLVNTTTFLYRRKIMSNNLINSNLNLATLPDEVLLDIGRFLPYKNLCYLSEVSRRLYTVATDESLWQRIDLAYKKLQTDWLMNILRRGVRVARLTGVEIYSPLMSPTLAIELIGFQSKLEFVDLSEAVIAPKDLELLLSKCRLLRKLSLEACELSEGVCKEIAYNSNLDTLNLCMCTGITASGLSKILISCQYLDSLNIAWASLDRASVYEIIHHVTPKIRKLNISGLRQDLTDKDLIKLVKRCTDLVELDVSDCVELTNAVIKPIVCNLTKLRSLSVSRCYKMNPASLSELSSLRNFSRLIAFRVITSDMLTRDSPLKNLKLNKEFLSTIARPTVGTKKTTVWGIKCKE
ncbi:hypothetical protein O3M35_013103 [Rhynocoris fuscipes]|uniref:F-box domain-containing protein n=1 Tax=Rhynocoris fuscipes TaxID=488301 RepID=A0AAW1CK54_9HEMI